MRSVTRRSTRTASTSRQWPATTWPAPADQPVVVDVLANDEDPDGDGSMIATIDGVPAEVAVAVTPDQRSGAGGATARFHRKHRVLVHGERRARCSASANVDVDAVSNDASNRPPTAETHIAEVRGGASAAFNVLNNDSDPDGDTFVLATYRCRAAE